MNILQISNFYHPVGGAEFVYTDTINLLRQHGHKVVCLSIAPPNDPGQIEDAYFIKPGTSFVDRFYSKDAVVVLTKIIEEYKPDVAHFHNIIGGITFSILPVLKKHKIPIVMTVHDFRLICPAYTLMDKNYNSCEKCAGGRYYNCIFQNCFPEGRLKSIAKTAESYLRDAFFSYKKYIDRFIFVSNFAQRRFTQLESSILNKSEVIYNFTKMFTPNKTKGKYFLFMGRLSIEKGLPFLIEAFKTLPDVQLKIAGEGNLRSQIESSITPNIELLGHKRRDELQAIIGQASYLIIPSTWGENMPLVTLEAYSLGKPVLAANIGGLQESIVDGKTGFHFTPASTQDIVSVIKRAIALSDDAYAEMSGGAYGFAMENFSPEIYYEKLLSLYEKLIREYNENRN